MMKRDFSRALRSLRTAKAPAGMAQAIYARAGIADEYFKLTTAIGDVYVALRNGAIAGVRRAAGDAAYERRHLAEYGRPARRLQRPDPKLLKLMRRHLAGDARAPLRFDLSAVSPFGRAVLTKALEIPRGEVRPYSWIAREIGRPLAVRAVGSALARNPIPLLIPCHRVVRNDGTAGQYIFGTAAKRALLSAEGAL